MSLIVPWGNAFEKLVFSIGMFIIDFFQDMYDKGKKLTEAEKKEVSMK